jgi:hypothetical protein
LFVLVLIDEFEEEVTERFRLVFVERVVDVMLAPVYIDELASDLFERWFSVIVTGSATAFILAVGGTVACDDIFRFRPVILEQQVVEVGDAVVGGLHG